MPPCSTPRCHEASRIRIRPFWESRIESGSGQNALALGGCGASVEELCGPAPIVENERLKLKVEGALDAGALMDKLHATGELKAELEKSSESIFKGEGESAEESLRRLAQFQYCSAVFSDDNLSGAERQRILQEGYQSIEDGRLRAKTVKREAAIETCVGNKLSAIQAEPLKKVTTSPVRARCQNHGDEESATIEFNPGPGYQLEGQISAIPKSVNDGGIGSFSPMTDQPLGAREFGADPRRSRLVGVPGPSTAQKAWSNA